MMTIIGVHIQIELKITHSFPIIAFGNTIYQNNNLSYFWLNSTLAQKSPVCQYSLAWISSPHEMGRTIVSPPPCFLSCLPLLFTLTVSHLLHGLWGPCVTDIGCLLLKDFSVIIVLVLHPCWFPRATLVGGDDESRQAAWLPSVVVPLRLASCFSVVRPAHHRVPHLCVLDAPWWQSDAYV